MKRRILLLILLSLAMGFLVEWAEVFHAHPEGVMSQGSHKYTNKLAQEKSPYLLQHAHNPVDWYPWEPEAFEKAKREDKAIFLSIGYSTCHWCHVMERESFENEEIARVMNEHFVSIKVDREERPDVDQIYMNAVQGMTGSGGWPLSAFLTHDLEPFWGGTYFPPERRWGRPGFKDILLEIARLWKEDRAKLTEAGREVGETLKKADRASGAGVELSVETLRRAYASFQDVFDAQEGGFGGAPKFPRSETVSLLLRIHRRTGERRALHMATLTLEKMARGGIYDHLGGGFHRYSTDDRWLVPHFEKMLYDNALLARAYLEAAQVDPNPMWKGVAKETLDYVLRVMTSPEGGFYSAEDADSEGIEGKYYVWKEEGLQRLLTPEEFKKVKEGFQVSPQGNWEGNSILNMNMGTPWAVRYGEPLAGAMRKLLAHRGKRIPPHKDDKVLVSWNGLMIGAMAYASQVLGQEGSPYLAAAQKAADFLLRKMWNGRDLKRRYREGDVKFAASLDDYAFLIQGLLDLYETDFDGRWFEAALALQKRSDDLFWDAKDGAYFFTDANDASLIARSKDVYDGAVPSGNSVAVLNLLRLYDFTLDDAYQKKAQTVLKVFADFVSHHPQASPAFLMALDYVTDASKEIVVAGAQEDPKVGEMLRKVHSQFLPNKVLALADRAGREKDMPLLEGKIPQDAAATLYLCENHTCRKPVHSVEEAGEALTKVNSYKLY